MEKEINEFIESLNKLFSCKLANQLSERDSGMNAVLCLLYDNDFMYAIDIAKKLDLSRARLSKIITKLILKEYVLCVEDDYDKRKYKIVITEKGRKYITSKKHTVYKKICTLYDKIGKKGAKSVISLADEIDEL